MKRWAGKKVYVYLSIIVIIVIAFIGYYNASPNVCVTREQSGNQVTLKIDVSSLHKPNSFIIEEFTKSNLSSSNLPVTLYNQETNKATWIFGKAFSEVKDTSLIYSFSDSVPDYAELVSADNPNNPNEGYSRKTISNGAKTCI